MKKGDVVMSKMGTLTRTMAVAGIIADGSLTLKQISAINKGNGWTVEGRMSGREYVSDSDYTRVEGVKLTAGELRDAKEIARKWGW